MTVLSVLAAVWTLVHPPAHAAEAFAFPVRTVRLEGVTVFREADLSPLVQEVIGQNVTLARLESLAEAITAFYRARGYPFAFAYVPSQEIVDRAVVIAVEEGRYAGVILDNQSSLNDVTALRLLGPVREGAVIEEQALAWAMRRLDGAAGVAATGAFRPDKTSYGFSNPHKCIFRTRPVLFGECGYRRPVHHKLLIRSTVCCTSSAPPSGPTIELAADDP